MRYKKPSVTVDGIVLRNNKILLVKRKKPPFENRWALPGGFVEYGEKTEEAVVREVFEETGLRTQVDKLFDVYSDPNRDPRGHTISIVYILKITGGCLKSGDDASEAGFFNVDETPRLSFDHDLIIKDLTRRMKKNVLP